MIRFAFRHMRRAYLVSAALLALAFVITFLIGILDDSLKYQKFLLEYISVNMPVHVIISDNAIGRTDDLLLSEEYIGTFTDPLYAIYSYIKDVQMKRTMIMISVENILYPFITTEKDLPIESYFVGITAVEADLRLLTENGVSIQFAYGYDASVFAENLNVCIVGETLLAQTGKAIGDEIEIKVISKESVFSESTPEPVILKLKIVGCLYGDGTNRIYAPFDIVTDAAFKSDGSPVITESLSATISDNTKIAEFKKAAQKYYTIKGMEGPQYVYALTVHDDTYNKTIAVGERNIHIHQITLVIVLVLSSLIGFAACLLLTQRRRQEFAVMRSLGTKKRHIFITVLLEQSLLSVAGAVFAVVIYLYINKDWIELVFVLIFLASFIFGVAIALWRVLSLQVMRIMLIKE